MTFDLAQPTYVAHYSTPNAMQIKVKHVSFPLTEYQCMLFEHIRLQIVSKIA